MAPGSHTLAGHGVGMDPALRRMLVLCIAIVVACELAIRLAASHDPVADAVAKAQAQERQGDMQSALEQLRQATSRYPHRSLGWLELATRLIPYGTRAAEAEALHALQQAMVCEDDAQLVATARRDCAVVLGLYGRLPEALPLLERSAAAGDGQAERLLALIGLETDAAGRGPARLDQAYLGTQRSPRRRSRAPAGGAHGRPGEDRCRCTGPRRTRGAAGAPP